MPQFIEMHRPALWDEVRPGRGQLRADAPRTIVVGYDGSPAASRALLYAADAAGSGGHVGARGDSYFARALRDSVGERLIARAPCDLLIAR